MHPNDPRNRHHIRQREETYGNREQDVADWFVYTVSIGNLAAGAAPANQNQQVEADSDFDLMKLDFYATLNGKTPPFSYTDLAELTLQIVDTGSGRQLFSQATPIAIVAGNQGGLPFILPQPRRFVAKSSIQLTVATISAASQYNNIFVSLIGRKIFHLGGGR